MVQAMDPHPEQQAVHELQNFSFQPNFGQKLDMRKSGEQT